MSMLGAWQKTPSVPALKIAYCKTIKTNSRWWQRREKDIRLVGRRRREYVVDEMCIAPLEANSERRMAWTPADDQSSRPPAYWLSSHITVTSLWYRI